MSVDVGDLEEVAQFLTSFQDYFQADDELLERVISPEEVQDAIVYQELLEEATCARYVLSLKNGDRVRSSRVEKQLQKTATQLRGTSRDVKLIHRMLKRFEVWMTKHLARTMFAIPPSQSEMAGKASMLNFPSVASLGLLIDIGRASPPRKRRRKSGSNWTSSLMLPPNHWTWREYFRLGYMVSLLESPEAVLEANQSFVDDKSVMLRSQEGAESSHEKPLSAANLVSLWVRAQRSTNAWRLLTQLFKIDKARQQTEEVTVAGNGKSGKRLLVLQREGDHVPADEYVAKYVGNDSQVLSAFQKESVLMDTLVVWAVTNQVMFTQKYMVEGLETGHIPDVRLDVPAEAYELNSSRGPFGQPAATQANPAERQTKDSGPTDERVARYTHYASLVGSVVLILPGDPVRDIPAWFLEQSLIRLDDKPTPFIVASYLPSFFVDLKPGGCVKDRDSCRNNRDDGMFQLLPVMCFQQLAHLQSLTEIRQDLPSQSGKETHNSANFSLIDLPGLVSLNPGQLLRRMDQSRAIEQAIGVAIAREASLRGDPTLDDTNCSKNHSSCLEARDEGYRFWNASAFGKRPDARLSTNGAFLGVHTEESDLPCTYAALIKSTLSFNPKIIFELLTASTESEEGALSAEDHHTGPGHDQDSVSDHTFETDDSSAMTSTKNYPDKLIVEVPSPSRNQVLVHDEEFAIEGESVAAEMIPAETHAPCSQGRDLTAGHYLRTTKGDHSATYRHTDDDYQKDESDLQEYQNLTSRPAVVLQPEHPAGMRAEIGAPEGTLMSRMLCLGDVGKAGPAPTYLSLIETVVVAATVNLGFPILARRLLCPRYRWSQADLQVRVVQEMDLQFLPSLPPGVLNIVLWMDSRRSDYERGPIIAQEREFNYRLPVISLYIDVVVAKRLGGHGSKMHRNNQLNPRDNHHMQQLSQLPSMTPGTCHPPHDCARNSFERDRVSLASNMPQDYCHAGAVSPYLENFARGSEGEAHPQYSPFVDPPPSIGLPSTSPICHATGERAGIPPGNTRPSSQQEAANAHNGHLCDRRGVVQIVDKSRRDTLFEKAVEIRREEGLNLCVDAPDRIRGGGPKDYSRPRLSDLPQHEWGRQVVTATVQTAKKGVALEDAMIVGFVDPKGKETDPEFVDVNVIFVSNHGLLETASTQALPLSSLFIAEGGSEEECISTAWRERLLWPQNRDESLDDSLLIQSEISCSNSSDARHVDTNKTGLDGCFDGIVSSSQLECASCSLCRGGSKECLDGEMAGLGCALGIAVIESRGDVVTYTGPTSSISMSKSVLVHIANNLPHALRLHTRASPPSLWRDARYQGWCTFVKKSMCPRQLAQALVVFLSSIKEDKLPRWWNCPRAGWSKAFVLMSQPTCSGLLLQLYVLDAAIAEFVERSHVEKHVAAAVP